VLREDLSHITPLFADFYPENVFALGTQVVYFCLEWVTFVAEVVEENVDLHVFVILRLVFRFFDLLGGELALARNDVVSILDERRIEHDSEFLLVIIATK
jgi:hypothetical protein